MRGVREVREVREVLGGQEVPVREVLVRRVPEVHSIRIMSRRARR